MRARSRSSISAITCLPERLIVRSSSSSRIDAVAREPAFARERRRIVDERRFDQLADVRQVVELRDAASRRAAPADPRAPSAARGIDRERLLQADQVARTGGAQRGPGDQPLEILHALDGVAELAAFGRAKRELLDGVQPIAGSASERQQRPEQPRRAAGGCAIDVTVRSSSSSSDPARPPSDPSRISRCLSVVGSMSSASARWR